MLRDQKLVVVTQKSPETQDPGRKDLHKIGTLVTVKQIMKLQNISGCWRKVWNGWK